MKEVLRFVWLTKLFTFQEYGSLEYCPEYITGEIVEMQALTQNEVSLRIWYPNFSRCKLDLLFLFCVHVFVFVFFLVQKGTERRIL